jgi:hypothetical protein
MSAPWTLDAVLKLSEEIEARPRPEEIARGESFHAAAALLTSFVIDPTHHTGPDAANLVEDSRPVSSGPRGRWCLKNDVRKRVLTSLKTEQNVRAAWQANRERPDDLVQQTIDALVLGNPKSLQAQTPEELSATLQVADWFSETELAQRLPSVETVRTQVEYAAFMLPLRTLVGAYFRGRSIELAALRAYVGDPADVLSLQQRPPVLIFGPGGMGKSTLVAKFILDHLHQFPFVYLDCDRPGLVAEEPITLLAEAVDQLGLQFPQFQTTARKLRNRWLREIAEAHEGSRGQPRGTTLGRTRIMKEFLLFVHDLALQGRVIVLVVDTFEEIYARSRAFVQEVFNFLNELQALLPKLRTILAGRHPIPDFQWVPLELGLLDDEAAEGFLEALGVTSAPYRKRLASLLHGNPLSLRLAATLARKDSNAGLEELEVLSDDTEIQGILYRRILGHVREEVRQLAHPGLILRRITPDLIRRVLAIPCGLPSPSEAEAQRLFDLLQNELSLVTPERGAVRHRADVRRVMLSPLKKDRPEEVRAIEEAAVEYYAPANDAESRAEEIYHRLSLGQSPGEVDDRWMPGIEESLHSAVEEITGPARAYLASRLQMELYDEDWLNVDQRTWELHAENRAGDLLRLGRPLEALRALRRRSTRLPHTPLYWYEAQALQGNGQILEAREVARRGLVQLLGNAGSPSGVDLITPAPGAPTAIAYQLMAWYAGPELNTPPSAADACIRLEYLELLQPLRDKVRDDFSGRQRELEALRSYVTGGGAVTDLNKRPPLLIQGPGGIGKSALIAKFLLNHLGRLPFVHLDFAVLDPNPPSSVWLLAEIARQLSLQYPGSYPQVREEIQRLGSGATLESALRTATETFGSLFSVWVPENLNIVLFIDHLEEWRGNPEEAYELLRQFQALLPRLRAVIVGRIDWPNLRFERLVIGALDMETADTFLAAHGIASKEARARVTNFAQGSPYTLRLVADFVRKEGPDALAQFEARPSDTLQTLLQRVLTDIADPVIRQVMPAALVLRLLTPDLLKRLAKILHLPGGTEADIAKLFKSLCKQQTFFTSEGDVLRPRIDVRRIMLQALARFPGVPVAAINEAAVQYYETQEGIPARAEEIYHRLALGQPPEVIQARWLPGMKESLRGAVDEFEGGSRLYLAARLGIALTDAEWQNADQPTWERFVAFRAKELSSEARYVEALELLHQRSTRLPKSPLFAIEAEELYLLGRLR